MRKYWKCRWLSLLEMVALDTVVKFLGWEASKTLRSEPNQFSPVSATLLTDTER